MTAFDENGLQIQVDQEPAVGLTIFEPLSDAVSIYPVHGYGLEEVKSALRTYFSYHGACDIVSDNHRTFQGLEAWVAENFGTRAITRAITIQTRI